LPLYPQISLAFNLIKETSLSKDRDPYRNPHQNAKLRSPVPTQTSTTLAPKNQGKWRRGGRKAVRDRGLGSFL